MKPLSSWIYFIPGVIIGLAITFLSMTGKVSAPQISWFSADKIGHALAYGSWAFVLIWGAWKNSRSIRLFSGILPILVLSTTVFGAFMEWIQLRFCPGRFFEYDDMLANAIGSILGSFIAARLFQ